MFEKLDVVSVLVAVFLGQAEIHNVYGIFLVAGANEKVAGFDVAVNVVVLVQKFHAV
jgi:hypothetical protein